MIAVLNASQVIRRVRRRLALSQEALARSLNATKGAVQHWERGRNCPDLARLLALRRLCPDGRERTQLDALIRQAEAGVTPPAAAVRVPRTSRNGLHHTSIPSPSPAESLSLLRREKDRLQQKVMELETIIQKRDVQLRILESLAEDLQRELINLRATRPPRRADHSDLSKAG